jgi:hypothetical protein
MNVHTRVIQLGPMSVCVSLGLWTKELSAACKEALIQAIYQGTKAARSKILTYKTARQAY